MQRKYTQFNARVYALSVRLMSAGRTLTKSQIALIKSYFHKIPMFFNILLQFHVKREALLPVKDIQIIIPVLDSFLTYTSKRYLNNRMVSSYVPMDVDNY